MNALWQLNAFPAEEIVGKLDCLFGPEGHGPLDGLTKLVGSVHDQSSDRESPLELQHASVHLISLHHSVLNAFKQAAYVTREHGADVESVPQTGNRIKKNKRWIYVRNKKSCAR